MYALPLDVLMIKQHTPPLCTQVGTEANPFPEQYTATIKLYGHLRSRELPIYGTKVLALREGTLDLHGHPTPVTWTTLSTTANAGDTQITLTTPVNWKVHTHVFTVSVFCHCCDTLFSSSLMWWGWEEGGKATISMNLLLDTRMEPVFTSVLSSFSGW